MGILLLSAAWAGQAILRLQADELREGQTVGLNLVVVDAEPRGVPDLRLPTGLRVSFESQARERQIINFKATSSTTLTYALTALSSGDYEIPALVVQTDAGALTTEPLKLRVEPRATGALETLAATLDARTAWVGQVLLYELRFQTDKKVVNGRWSPPDAPGFLAEPTVQPFTREYSVDQDGKALSIMELAYPLRAIKPGAWTVPAGVLQAQFAVTEQRKRRRSDSYFLDGIGPFGNMRNEVYSSEPVAVEVKDLPTEGRPADASALVGRFTIDAKASATEARVGDTITVEVTVSGDGLLAGYALPPLTGDSFRVYDDQPVVEARLEEGRYTARASYKRAIVPQVAGKLEVPPIELAYFDPTRGAWARVSTEPIRLTVTGEAAAAKVEAFDRGGDRRLVEALGEDILPVRTDASLAPPPHRGLAALLVLPGLGLLTMEAVRGLARRRRAPSVEPLPGLADLPADPEARLAAIERAFRARVGAKLGVAPDGLRREHLEGLGPRAAEAVELYRALERCRFGDARDVPEAQVRAFLEGL